MKLGSILILEKDNNKKGDLFGKLVADFFHVIGYSEPRLNIHKTGREIDLESFHRIEKKKAICECKAYEEKIGGADINKFVGVLEAEKIKLKKNKLIKDFSLVGFFISLSGYKETALEQENDLDNKRLILITPERLVEELISGKILVSIEKAISVLNIEQNLSLIESVDLLATEKGWVWAIYFSNCQGQKKTHVTFIHAEGNPLLQDLSLEIMNLDANSKFIFKDLTLIKSQFPSVNENNDVEYTKEKYFSYLENELGEIQFEGLPTDKEAGSVRVKLENIFVPLHLNKTYSEPNLSKESLNDKRHNIGNVLKSKSKLAILAKPGGGKSTLIKRIAIAYAFPDRRKLINDSLPNKDLFPIFLRCRELGNKVQLSINEIINEIPKRAEIISCTNTFTNVVSKCLQNGNALLLIDGLDEISDDKDRISFVNQLRTFIATYPNINLILTSREAGFRIVAGSLATYCESYTVSKLIPSEIEELSIKWHKAIIDDSETTKNEAIKLSKIIINDNRIKSLAENPLLLTTLLFVKRWAGYLPTKRNVLYQEMIKLLLVTWNVEGHEIIDIEEAEPQLAFVAFWMIKNGKQTITSEELKYCLVDARKQMPEILGYTNISPTEFIKRVELRSSLLILSGHKRTESGLVQTVYEFLHLSFQEYLAAKAIVKKYVPNSEINKNVVEIIKSNAHNENWKEVVPLTAVLLERDTKDLIIYLISECKKLVDENASLKNINSLAPSLLGSCLANEIQITPEILDTAIEWYAKNNETRWIESNTEIILNNKFGNLFRKKISDLFQLSFEDIHFPQVAWSQGEIFIHDSKSDIFFNSVIKSLDADEHMKKWNSVIGLTVYSFGIFTKDVSHVYHSDLTKLFRKILKLEGLNEPQFQATFSWLTVWSLRAKIFPINLKNLYVKNIISFWLQTEFKSTSRFSAWALSLMLTPDYEKKDVPKIIDIGKKILDKYNYPKNEFDKIVSIYVGSIVGIDYDLHEITSTFKNAIKDRKDLTVIYLFAEKFGMQLDD